MPIIKLPQLNKTIEARQDGTVFDALRAAGVFLDAPCGGKKRCKKCKVVISPAHACESRAFLSQSEYERGARLACYYNASHDMSVILSDEDQRTTHNAQRTIKVNHPVGEGNFSPFTFHLSPQTDNCQLSVAVDIGTTTVALEIYDESKETVSSAFFLNPQKAYGADVISRINACNDGHLPAMRAIILDALKPYIGSAAKVIIAANTTMLHILAGVSPKSIGEAPYKAEFTETREYRFQDFNIPGNGIFVLMPGADAYIGADVIAGVLSGGMYENVENSILVDLGTNGEIVLKANGKYYAAAAAAGPAFEGVNISCGTYAAGTAVAAATLQGSEIIVDKPAADTVCGAGLIALLACLLERGDVDESGAIASGEPTVKIGNVVLTQKDFREVQLAKAAINATIKMLIKTAGITGEEITRVYLAGGFGKGLDPVSAGRIGLLPEGFAQKTTAIGNSSLAGARLCAKDGSLIRVCADIANSISVVRLTENAEFFELYTEAMTF